MIRSLLTVAIRYEQDVVLSRQRARQLAQHLGFDGQDQTRIATAVSEIARNAFKYGRGGKVEFLLADDPVPQMEVRVSDQGGGIRELKNVLAGTYRSETGMGLGIIGSRRLMDRFEIASSAEGTTVTLAKDFPARAPAPGPRLLAEVARQLAMSGPQSPLDEMRQQNQELIEALEAVRVLNRELEETNRGVVALYAELDEKAQSLQRANHVKTRFLANMSHELRTPLNSILSLSHMLLKRSDGELSEEQDRQVGYIRRSAEDLSEIVNDLLDLARVEAGKTPVRVETFEAKEVLLALRGMFRPFIGTNPDVELIIDEPGPLPPLISDQGKLGQILRNLVSNALKFTERGHVRVSAERLDEMHLIFHVRDTGIGIARENHERVFEEFTQIENPLQKAFKGTGLGLPLARRLGELLGGRLFLESEVGRGTVFSLALPLTYSPAATAAAAPSGMAALTEVVRFVDDEPLERRVAAARERLHSGKILIVDDDEIARYLLSDILLEEGFETLEADTGEKGLELIARSRPRAVFLDLELPGISGRQVLERLRADESNGQTPVIIVTSKQLADEELEALSAMAVAVVAKGIPARESTAQRIRQALKNVGVVSGDLQS